MRDEGGTVAGVVWEAELPGRVRGLALPYGDVVVDPRKRRVEKKKTRPSL